MGTDFAHFVIIMTAEWAFFLDWLGSDRFHQFIGVFKLLLPQFILNIWYH